MRGRAFPRGRSRYKPRCRGPAAGGLQTERTLPDGVERRALFYDDLRTFRRSYTSASLYGRRASAPILVREGSPPKRLDAMGFAIGMFDEADYEESAIDLQHGDRLYLHSDGLTEEVNAHDEAFGR